jgi:transposase
MWKRSCNKKLEIRRNRRGGTSPLLVCIELNPGPGFNKRKATRKVAKNRQPKKYKQLTEFQKGEIAMGIDLGVSRSKLRRQLGTGSNTIKTWADRYEEEGKMERKSGSGRPRMTTSKEDRLIVRQSERNRKLTATKIARTLEAKDNSGGSPKPTRWTVGRRLLDAGLPARRPRKKPLLTKKHKQARLKWAKDHLDWTSEQWNNVLWSDETSFTLFPRSHGYIRRRTGEETKDECITPTVKGGGGKIMVWGCFHSNSVGVIRKVDGNMDQHQYHTILTHSVLPEIKKLAQKDVSGVIWTFQHDNDPKHTAKINQRYLKWKQDEGKIKFQVLPWSSNSPDLNPIEHLWNKIKDALADRPDRPSNLDQLFEMVKEEWKKLPKDFLQNLVNSMPRRMRAVIRNQGGSTTY